MLTVKLSNGNRLIFPKDKLQTIFPESLLTQAAEFDDSVELTSPLITPSLLQLLQTMVLTGRIPDILPSDIDYVSASHYLDIPLLTALADPWFPTYRYLNPEINLLPNNLHPYARYLNSAIGGEAALITWYIMRSVKPDLQTQTIEAEAFVYAAWLGVASIVKIMLSRVNPALAHAGELLKSQFQEHQPEYKVIEENKPNQALFFALYRNHSDVIALLLADPRTHLDLRFDYWRIYDRISTLNFQRLIQHPDITARILEKFRGLNSASDAARLLFQHPQYDPSMEWYSHLDDLIRRMDEKIDTIANRDAYDLTAAEVINANIIYWHPKTDPTIMWDKLLYNERHDIDSYYTLPTGLVEGWVFDPRLRLDELRPEFYFCLLWLWSPRILEKFIQTYPQLKLKLQELALQEDPISEPLNSPDEINMILNIT